MNSSTFIRKNFRRTALASIVALGAFGASNSFAADATTSATGTVIVPIAITKSADLVFGKFAPGTALGTVMVTTDGNRTASGDVILSSVDSSPTAAQFDVTGDGAATYSISWPLTSELTNTGGTSETMALERISSFTADGATTGDISTGTLTDGTQSFYLGGILDVAGAQAAGTYTGDVSVTVEYN